MHTAAEYRKMAEECFEWATTAVDDEVRANYLGIAQIWLQAASRLRRRFTHSWDGNSRRQAGGW